MHLVDQFTAFRAGYGVLCCLVAKVAVKLTPLALMKARASGTLTTPVVGIPDATLGVAKEIEAQQEFEAEQYRW